MKWVIRWKRDSESMLVRLQENHQEHIKNVYECTAGFDYEMQNNIFHLKLQNLRPVLNDLSIWSIPWIQAWPHIHVLKILFPEYLAQRCVVLLQKTYTNPWIVHLIVGWFTNQLFTQLHIVLNFQLRFLSSDSHENIGRQTSERCQAMGEWVTCVMSSLIGWDPPHPTCDDKQQVLLTVCSWWQENVILSLILRTHLGDDFLGESSSCKYIIPYHELSFLHIEAAQLSYKCNCLIKFRITHHYLRVPTKLASNQPVCLWNSGMPSVCLLPQMLTITR